MTPSPTRRWLHSPLDDNQLRPLEPECMYIYLSTPLTDRDYRRASDFTKANSHVPLRIGWDFSNTIRDLNFLEYFPHLTNFGSDIYELEDMSGLKFLAPSLQELFLGATRRRFSMRVMEAFDSLKSFYLTGPVKDFEAVGELTSLERFAPRSVSIPSLKSLVPLRKLHTFELRLGGIQDVSNLPEIGRLRYLEIWMVRGLEDLSFLSELTSLQKIYLHALKNVTKLPSFGKLLQLRRVMLNTMKGLHDLSPIAEAPALEDFLAIAMTHLEPEAFLPFKGHPTLRSLAAGVGSDRKGRAVRDFLPLPSSSSKFEFR